MYTFACAFVSPREISPPIPQMEHDRQMALKAESDKVAARKKLLEVQRSALHAQMQERESLKREVSRVEMRQYILYHICI